MNTKHPPPSATAKPAVGTPCYTLEATVPSAEIFNAIPKGHNWSLTHDGERGITCTVYDTQSNCVAAKFSITALPGCNRTLLFHSAEVAPHLRGKGYGVKLHSVRLAWAKAYGATVLLCTVNENNEPQRRILQREGWHLAEVAQNNDGGDFGLWVKVLPPSTVYLK